MDRIIIPMSVEAILANGRSVDQNCVPVYGPDYRKVSYVSMLGSKNTPGDFERGEVLRAGAHLHFILPDAMTHADGEAYPAVPDRYLVTRLYENREGRIDAKCFLVESNFMSRDSRYSKSVTIPMFQEPDLRKNWRYLGRSYDLLNIPQKQESDEYLETLTALGPGDPMFAAYYPSCSSVFGFYDPLEDVEKGTVLTYFVAGYYSNPGKDPFSGVTSEKDMEEILEGLRISVMGGRTICSRCVLFGEITGVRWEGIEADYSPKPSGTIDVAVGYTSAEALAAVAAHMSGAPAGAERMLTALQYHLADSGEFLDGNYKMDDEIYLRQFQRVEGEGDAYRLVLEEKASKETPRCGENWGSIFSAVQNAAERLAQEKRELAWLQKKLYTVWEQYMRCYEDPSCTPKGVPARGEMLAEIRRIAGKEIPAQKGRIADCKQRLCACREAFCREAGELGHIQRSAGNPFYIPKDPVILLSGTGVKRAYAFGEDGRFTQDGTLECQVGVVQTNAAKEEILSCLERIPPAEQYLDGYRELLCQALVLSGDCLPALRKRVGEIQIQGNIPSVIASNQYHSDPIALWMAWEVQYLPTAADSVPDSTLDGWSWNEGETNYVYTGGKKPEQLGVRHLSGRTVLTPHAVLQLSQEMEKWGNDHPEYAGMAEQAKKVRDLGMISQNMDGLTQGLLALKNTFQFPIMGAGGDEAEIQAVREEASGERASLIPDMSIRHLRGGMIRIFRLELIGTFGQVHKVMDENYFSQKEIVYAETMETVDGRYALLSPAFHDPVRLTFCFHSGTDDHVLSSAAQDTSPVYGIILPELINRRLLVYEAGGDYVGSVNTAYRQTPRLQGNCGGQEAVWVSAKDPKQLFEETEFRTERLRDYVAGLLETKDALRDVLELMEQYYEKKQIPEEGQQIWGRPFVLVRCGMRLEFDGQPEFDKSFSSFGTYDTKQAQQIRIAVRVGGMDRVTDGVLGCFEDTGGFRRFHPCFGAELLDAGEYFVMEAPRFQGNRGSTSPPSLGLSAAEGEKMLTLMMEPRGKVTVQTGIMPGMTLELEGTHGREMEKLCLEAEMNPVLAARDTVSLPVEGYSWKYRRGDTYRYQETVPQTADFAPTVLMDGFIVRGRES